MTVVRNLELDSTISSRAQVLSPFRTTTSKQQALPQHHNHSRHLPILNSCQSISYFLPPTPKHKGSFSQQYSLQPHYSTSLPTCNQFPSKTSATFYTSCSSPSRTRSSSPISNHVKLTPTSGLTARLIGTQSDQQSTPDFFSFVAFIFNGAKWGRRLHLNWPQIVGWIFPVFKVHCSALS